MELAPQSSFGEHSFPLLLLLFLSRRVFLAQSFSPHIIHLFPGSLVRSFQSNNSQVTGCCSMYSRAIAMLTKKGTHGKLWREIWRGSSVHVELIKTAVAALSTPQPPPLALSGGWDADLRDTEVSAVQTMQTLRRQACLTFQICFDLDI